MSKKSLVYFFVGFLCFSLWACRQESNDVIAPPPVDDTEIAVAAIETASATRPPEETPSPLPTDTPTPSVTRLAVTSTPQPPTPTTTSTQTPAVVGAPVEVLQARDAALAYVRKYYADGAPKEDIGWVEREVATGLVGASTYEYIAPQWVLTVTYPIVLPSLTIYRVLLTGPAEGFRWIGEVSATGQVAEISAEWPKEEPAAKADGWAGWIVKLPAGSQFGHYFLRDDGQRFDISSSDEEVTRRIVEARWTGAQVKVWGLLAEGVPAAESRQIVVQKVEIISGPALEARNLSPFAIASASSALPSDRWGTYHAASAIDGSLSTCWSEGVAGPGIGEWITLTFPAPIELTSIGVDVGYDREETDSEHSPELFARNNRLKRAAIYFSEGQSLEWTFRDERGVQMVPLSMTSIGPIRATWVKLEIKEVYPGSRYDDTCIAEIEVWGRIAK